MTTSTIASAAPPVANAAASGPGRPGQATAPLAASAASVWERQTFSALLESAVAAPMPDGAEAPVAPAAGLNLPAQPANQTPSAAPVATASGAQATEPALAALAQAAIEAALTTAREHPLAAAPAIALRMGGALAGTTLWLSRRGDGWGIGVADARREQRQLLSTGEQELVERFARAGLGSLQLEFT